MDQYWFSTLKMNNPHRYSTIGFYLPIAFSVMAILAAFATDRLVLMALPIALAGATLFFTNNSIYHYLLWLSIPLSFDFSISPSLTITLPTEPIMLVLLASVLFLFALRKNIDNQFIGHPIILLLIAHLLWMFYGIFYSVAPNLSLKYFLAKLWYFAAFIFIPSFIFQKIDDFKKTFWAIFISLFSIVCICLAKHGVTGFSFNGINPSVTPFFPNHVMYSALIGLFLPFVWYATNWYGSNTLKNYWIRLAIIVFIIAVGFSYTRTTIISLPAALIAVWALRKRLLPVLLIIGAICISGFVLYLNNNNKYLDYAPNYQTTVFNKNNFEKHLEATYKLEDVSGMERVYRWVAAVNMIKAHPITGTGTNTFYPEYKRYTVTAFKTYLSENPEHSTTHNYFLLLLAEQGIIGFLLFSSIYIILLIRAHHIYHFSSNKHIKRLTLAVYFSLIVFLVHLMLGDMVESDKTGSIFLLCIALMVKLDIWAHQEKRQVSSVTSSANN